MNDNDDMYEKDFVKEIQELQFSDEAELSDDELLAMDKSIVNTPA